jgi:serine/tyrosine/threonine adenylyltransferase
MASFLFENSYARDLEGLWLKAAPSRAPAPQLIRYNHALAGELGLDVPDAELAGVFSGNTIPDGALPLAMAYAGHQFGHFSPQLGDGRAILLGEVIDRNGKRRDIQLKGPGRTPFSRNGDGRAALGPVLREYIVSEAMHALGIPATRALAAVLTGDEVYRETVKPGAVFTRVASSHIRVGTFQFFAARGDVDALKRLANFAIARHFPQALTAERPYLALLEAVADTQARLIAQWVGIGFVHGVMNTDNMAISGETIDFGPCAFIDHYDPHALFSSIDQNGRYAFSNQPLIAQWNLARLAEALVPLIDVDQDMAVNLASKAIEAFPERFEGYRLDVMRAKLGLQKPQDGDAAMIKQFLDRLQMETVDYAVALRALGGSNADSFLKLFADKTKIKSWLNDWRARLASEGTPLTVAREAMRGANPAFIPRNHRIEQAIRAAEDHGNFAPFNRLVDVLARPYQHQPENAEYLLPPQPDERVTKTFCGT